MLAKLNLTLDEVRLIREAVEEKVHDLNNIINDSSNTTSSRTELIIQRNKLQDLLRIKLCN